MGYPGRYLAKSGQLLLDDDLILGSFQLGQNLFELTVLLHQFGGHLFHQVEPLDLQGVATENLQRSRHVGHLVSSADIDLAFQITFGHLSHPLGQEVDTAQQNPTDKAIADNKGRYNTQDADRQQQGSSGVNSSIGGLVGHLGTLTGGGNQRINLENQLIGKAGGLVQQIVLLSLYFQLGGQKIEAVIFHRVHFEQSIKNRGQKTMQLGSFNSVQADPQAAGGRLETLLEGLDKGHIGDTQPAGNKLDGQGGLRLERGQMAIAVELRLRKVDATVHRGFAQLPVARQLVEQLIVNGGHDQVVEVGSKADHLLPQLLGTTNQVLINPVSALYAVDVEQQLEKDRLRVGNIFLVFGPGGL